MTVPPDNTEHDGPTDPEPPGGDAAPGIDWARVVATVVALIVLTIVVLLFVSDL